MHIQADVLAEMISNKYHIRKNKVSTVMRNFFNTCSDDSIKIKTMVKIINDDNHDWKTDFAHDLFDTITDVYPMSIKRIYVDF